MLPAGNRQISVNCARFDGRLDAIVVVVEARPAEATFPSKLGNIASAGRDATDDTEIYKINAGGGSKFKVTDNGTGGYEPSLGSS